MSKSFKKPALLFLWLALLGGLMFAITHFSGAGSGPDSSVPPQIISLAPPDAALAAKRWSEIVAHAAAPPRGEAHALYTLAEFGDFQCPQCGKARPILEQMVVRYPKQVNLIFLHRPFPHIHKYALAAAEASDVAAIHGKFWPMYDILYTHQDDLEPGSYGDYAAQIGLNKTTFDTALLARKGKPTLDAATALSDALGVQETPTVMVHDNIHGAVKIYIGLSGKGNPPGIPGISALPLHPPWLSVSTTTENISHAAKRS